ncbi:MAG: hypothetical protein JRF65_16250, partial [Deltaproteobacteria bacterium]|nr:hypothetical protein [Deltaproteobacteria bacterium]
PYGDLCESLIEIDYDYDHDNDNEHEGSRLREVSRSIRLAAPQARGGLSKIPPLFGGDT